MKKLSCLILTATLFMSPITCLAEEKAPIDCPVVTINGAEFSMGMSYSDCTTALAETKMKDADRMHFPALRIGVEPLHLDFEAKWIEGSGNFYGPVDLRFVASMPEGLDQKDTDGAVAALEADGRLIEVEYDLADAEEFELKEFIIDGQVFNSETTAEDMKAFADARGYLFEENEDICYCGAIDEEVNGAAFTIGCRFTDESRSELKYVDYAIEPEYFMYMNK